MQVLGTRSQDAGKGQIGTGRDCQTRAIENGFPFETLAAISELESWRKEIHRPIYHIHKWWAQRLGSVFRACVLACFTPRLSDIMGLYYQPIRLPDPVVFDPFMGSGTTLGEALKLGCRVIGRDINPVAFASVCAALQSYDREQVIQAFRGIEIDVAPGITEYYKSRLKTGEAVDVLYYFWVRVVNCPDCKKAVRLFSKYLFAQHAYPSKHPEARAVCPNCGDIIVARFDDHNSSCRNCGNMFDPQSGPANGASAVCPSCERSFSIARTVRESESTDHFEMYAKLVLLPNGDKRYLPIDDFDRVLYERATIALAEYKEFVPVVPIMPGHNTNQVLNYGYAHWHEMFNRRQLLCLAMLAKRIRQIEDDSLRDLFTVLLSGCLEFNNMFCSYKGEGTGAVRHMFSHHVLKPERTPLEANVWGTPKSSGSFSTLFESRILKALDYKSRPFEIRAMRDSGKAFGDKVYGLSGPVEADIAFSYESFEDTGARAYLSCGDSAKTDLPSCSVDAVITDPPFFDNVHYSELADFFYVWQRQIRGDKERCTSNTTRDAHEVQNACPNLFAVNLYRVFAECARVLKPEGVLVFTYHHSRSEGWAAVLTALAKAAFYLVASHPVKAEMSVGVPKTQAKEPIDLDIILVARKKTHSRSTGESELNWSDVCFQSAQQIERLNQVGRLLSRNDVRVILMGQVMVGLSKGDSHSAMLNRLYAAEEQLQESIECLWSEQTKIADVGQPSQPRLF